MAYKIERLAIALQSSKDRIVIELLSLLLGMFLWDLTRVPRSIIPLFLLGWLSLRLRGSGWHEVGARKLFIAAMFSTAWKIYLGREASPWQPVLCSAACSSASGTASIRCPS